MKKPLLQSLLAFSVLAVQLPASAWDDHPRSGHHKHHAHHSRHYTHNSHRHLNTGAVLAGGILLGAALATTRPTTYTSTYYSTRFGPDYTATTYYPSPSTRPHSRLTYYSTPAPVYRETLRPVERYETRPVGYSASCYEVFYRNGVRIERELPDEACY